MSAPKILHIDIETAPNQVYAWGLWAQDIAINQIIEPGRTLCWAAKWHGKKGRPMFMSEHHDGHEEMVAGAHALLEEADILIHYNGTKFDVPTLNREFLKRDMDPPSGFKEIDLLRVVRSRFRFPSNKLDYVLQELGLGSKVKHVGMMMWRDCMAGCPKAWKVMRRYNIGDVYALEDLYNELLPWIKNHPNVAEPTWDGRPACSKCGSTEVKKDGTESTNAGVYQRYRCLSCRAPLRGATIQSSRKSGRTV